LRDSVGRIADCKHEFFPLSAFRLREAAAHREAWQVGPDGPSGPQRADDVHHSGSAHRGPVGPTRTYPHRRPPVGRPSKAVHSAPAFPDGLGSPSYGIGRSRVGGIDPEDHRVHLDRESIRILAVHRPAVFVMEDVRGIFHFPHLIDTLALPNRFKYQIVGIVESEQL
jgi:hypothetical protein